MGGQQGQPTTDTGTTPATKCCAALPVMAVVGPGEPREIRCMRVPRERAAVGHGAAERRSVRISVWYAKQTAQPIEQEDTGLRNCISEFFQPFLHLQSSRGRDLQGFHPVTERGGIPPTDG